MGLLAAALLLAGQLQAQPTASIRAYLLDCTEAHLADLPGLVQGASDLLQNACGFSLSLTAAAELKGGCGLPAGKAARRAPLRALTAPLKAAHPRDLVLLLLPGGSEPRYSWALIDTGPEAGCGSPQPASRLARFGVLFLSDFGLATAAQFDQGRAPASPSFASLLLAHEVMHALTQRPHPTAQPQGSLMADTLGRMGPRIPQDWCACALRSPYLR